MLQVGVLRVHKDKVGRLREWIAELEERIGEVRQTFDQEGTRHLQVHLLATGEGPILFYAKEVEDPEASRRGFSESELPIDREHQAVMQEVTKTLETELLLDASA